MRSNAPLAFTEDRQMPKQMVFGCSELARLPTHPTQPMLFIKDTSRDVSRVDVSKEIQ